jgi:outer membrane protein OmpA-like peptidoglycan-associated protein
MTILHRLPYAAHLALVLASPSVLAQPSPSGGAAVSATGSAEFSPEPEAAPSAVAGSAAAAPAPAAAPAMPAPEAGAPPAVAPPTASPAAADATSAPPTSGPATPPVAGSGAASAPTAVPPYAGARALRRPDPLAPAARFGSLPYFQRFRPTGNLWELGLFGGLYLPPENHNLKLPNARREAYGSPAVLLGGRVAYFPLSFVGAELEGWSGAGSTETTDQTVTFFALRGQAIFQLPLASVVPFVVVGGGVLGATSHPMGHDGDAVFHFGGGVKAAVTRLFTVRFDVRDNIGQAGGESDGTGTSHVELLLGASVTFDRPLPPPPRDRDYDGLFDGEDKCPTLGALTRDGCPLDGDADGVSDTEDECPRQPGASPTGCPTADGDADGVADADDACPAVAGPPPTGCLTTDDDADGVLAEDRCPSEPETKNGFEDGDGCPDAIPEDLKAATGIVPGITFKQGTADLDEASFATLDQEVAVLTKNPTVRVEVSGHTSSEGSDERNQELSEQRAEKVREYLVQRGVAPARVVARGAGASEPIADNETLEGRQQNRRIEIRILR